MEYDIIEKTAEIAVAEDKLEVKLERLSGLVMGAYGFDYCGFYLLEPLKSRLELRAYTGGKRGVSFYSQGEGLAWEAFKGSAPVEAFKRAKKGARWNKIEDKGLEGFRWAVVIPIKGYDGTSGVMYLKSLKKITLSNRRRQALKAIALNAALAVKFSAVAVERDSFSEELEDLKQKLTNAERLLAIGDMAATLAHDIKNPLISVGGLAARLKRQLAPDSPGIRYIDQIIKEIARVEKIMNAITRCLRENETDLRPDDINDILEEALELFTDELRFRNIRLEKSFIRSPLTVLADREQLKIAFDNLIANAIQSMKKGGTLTLVTGMEKGNVLAKVQDSGGGIKPADIGFIFNPFFTTKEYGTGLGLSITNSIVMRHKGVIEVNNVVGTGVTFVLKFPYAEMRIARPAGRGLIVSQP